MILIADSGSTKTDWRILDQNEVIAQTQTVGFNPYYQDADSIANELKVNLLPLCTKEVTQVFYYGTGVTNEEKAGVIKEAILKVFPTCKQIEAQSDVVGAARAACGKTAGIACILGTGSNSIYFDGEKTSFQVPPLGFWLGDEGSGGHLGKSLLLSYLHKEMPLEIGTKFETQYGAMDRLTVLENAYHKPFPNRYFASFSRFLFDNLNEDFCSNLVENCFLQFFQKYILKYPMCHETNMNFVGSVAFYYKELLTKVANSQGIKIGRILETPISGLVEFHQK
ncbi:ATPase [Emticicia aquatilis]|uniref:ATPase n=1 Tax=Emticicia aquatilis TaxID=1537369 RepID=A0A916YW86_9BACT|nr:N-acetylglucosamine kinase [Emticicia aquatilis]GGD63770.1 ATPase [Emticicia aquatilis]